MISLIVAFVVITLIVAGFVLFSKLNWLQFAVLTLVIGILIMFVPVFFQHQAVVGDKEFVCRGEQFSKYYCDTDENKYYEIALEHNWRFWDVYSVTEVAEADIPQK